jgi:hypothetical protein
MDLNEIETLNLNAFGGIDALTVNDLTGTDLTSVNVDLAGTLGGTSGDGAADGITVNGTDSPDNISVTADALLGLVSVSGLHTTVNITNPEVANDSLTVKGLGGTDTLDLDPGVTSLIMAILNQ